MSTVQGTARDNMAGVERGGKKKEIWSDCVGNRLWGQLGCWKNLGGREATERV